MASFDKKKVLLYLLCFTVFVLICYYGHSSSKENFAPFNGLFFVNSKENVTQEENLTQSKGLFFVGLKESSIKFNESFVVSPETLSSESAFYGMCHKDTYGLPLSRFRNKPFSLKHEDWTKYFPSLMKSFDRYRSENPNKNPNSFTTSASTITKSQNYKVGDMFTAILQATDSKGEAKTFGGDYFRARLIRKNTIFPDGIPCSVVDNMDGTYTIKAPLPMQGRLILDVTLVMSVEGIHELNRQQTAMGSWGFTFTGTSESGETMHCDLNPDTDKTLRTFPKCDYSNPRNEEPWFCLMPPSKNCTALKYIVDKKPRKGMTLDLEKLCASYGCHLPIKNNIEITVSWNENEDHRSALPKCNKMFSEKVALSSQTTGYFENHTWKSLQCNNLETDSILDNKVVYLFGDSTIRQFYYVFNGRFKLRDAGPDNSRVWQQPRIGKSIGLNQKNLTLYYRAHGPPLRNPGPPSTRPYISDSIVEIPIGGENVIVVFNIGAHLVRYVPSYFLHRIKGIKDAVLQHQKKFPDTKFIVRGQNVVDYLFEWNIYRFEIMFKETFSGIQNMVYLPFWDITTVWKLHDFHPKGELLNQQALLMLSYMM